MKATIYFPAHPAHFDNQFTQEEIDTTFQFHQGWRDALARVAPSTETKIVLLTTPLGNPAIVLEDSNAPQKTGAKAIGDVRAPLERACATAILNLKQIMEGNRVLFARLRW